MTKVLVVDDDRTIRHVIRTVLDGAGFSTRVAKDGAAALKALRAERFDLMLLDVWMPRLNDLLAKLRTRKTRPRVVVMTSDDAPETLLKAVREQVRESIARAFRELLLNAIEWGGRLDPNGTVRIACLRAKRMLMYRIADPGPGFNIEDLPHAAIGQETPIAHVHVRERKGLRPGGFGLLTVHGSVDELLYNEKRNEVVFVSYLDGR